MAPESFKRKLTAILSADVKGYSRLMGENEAGTVKILTAYRKIMGELILQNRGRVVDSPGDNILAEFASVVDAVQCSVAAQNEFKARNAELPENRRMVFRIGVNLGDVIEEEGRLYGDGVNIAARLEGLADPGGICISKTALDQIESKLPLGYEYLGEQTVKNIAKPVGAYRVLMEPRLTVAGVAEKKAFSRKRRITLAIAGILILLLGALALRQFVLRPSPPPVEKVDPKKMAFPLPDKPSIAVLPFVNMSGDPKQEYIADGICESIITALCKIPEMFVIARTSTSVYKGKPAKIQQISEELGVRYVLEGSVQKTGERIRVTAQLIDAIGGHHLWADRYDRDTEDLFDVLDEISKRVAIELQVKLMDGDTPRMSQKTKNFEAWGCATTAWTLFRFLTKDSMAKIKELSERALKLDPEYAFAWGVLGAAHYVDALYGFTESRDRSFTSAVECIDKSLKLNPTLPCSTTVKARLIMMQRQFEQAIAVAEKAVELAPSNDFVYLILGYVMGVAGRFEEAIPLIKTAMRLNPYHPAWYLSTVGIDSFLAGRYEEALDAYKNALERAQKGGEPTYGIHLGLSATYIELGREEEARTHAAEAIKMNPKVSLEYLRKGPYSIYKDPAHPERFLIALRKAGLPEHPPLPLPDKPSIAVLPFVNISDDKSQEYFSDGLTEEIITALSKTPKLFVIARNSSFVYKGKPVNVQQVSRELGVKYVLEGSVRRSGDQLRITAQLIDATIGNHLWAERWDRQLRDVFAIQDEITMKITSAMQVKLTTGEVHTKGTESLEAYLKMIEGREFLNALNRDDNALARKKFEEAITLDPNYAAAHAFRGYTYAMDFAFGINREESTRKAFECTQKALSLDDSQLTIYTTMEFMYGFLRRHDEAIASGEKAVRIAPGSSYAQFSLGRALNFACRDNEALTYLEKAVRMNPFPPAHYFMHIGSAHLNLRNYKEAVSALKRALALTPRNQFARGCLIVAYVEMGRMEEARAEAREYIRTNPNYKPGPPEEYKKKAPWKDDKVTERFIEAYRKLRS